MNTSITSVSKLRRMTKDLHDIANNCNDIEQNVWLRHAATLISNIADQLQQNEKKEEAAS